MGKIERPSPYTVLGTVEVAGQKFRLLRSLERTLRDVDLNYRLLQGAPKRRELTKVFLHLVPDAPGGADFARMVSVVKGHVQEHWYLVQQLEVPDSCIVNQRERVRFAKELPTGEPMGELAPQKKRGALKVADVLRDTILRGLSDDDILAAVREQFPNSHTGKNSIAYYKVQLRKEGLLEPARRKKNP